MWIEGVFGNQELLLASFKQDATARVLEGLRELRISCSFVRLMPDSVSHCSTSPRVQAAFNQVQSRTW